MGTPLSAGVSRQQVVYEIEHSTSNEYYTDEVQAAYQQFLHRAADPTGLSAAVNFLAAGGTIEQVDAVLIGSPEYYQNLAGGTSAGFAAALYQDALGRPVDSGAAQSVEQFLAQGGTRSQAAANILASNEYRTDLVQSYYMRFFGRPADPSGEQGFINRAQRWSNGRRSDGVHDELE